MLQFLQKMFYALDNLLYYVHEYTFSFINFLKYGISLKKACTGSFTRMKNSLVFFIIAFNFSLI
jgi:hypothetical protein